MANPQSSASSFKDVLETKTDVECQQGRNDVPHWFLVLHPSGVSDAVLNHNYAGEGTPESPYIQPAPVPNLQEMEIIRYFHVSTIVAIMGVSLFVLGFAVGPLLWAPLSEFYGRQIVFFLTYFGLAAFSAGAAGAQNMHTLIILRFFAGAFGASPLTNSGGVIADMFSATERGMASSIFAMAPFLGPTIGPIVGGFLGEAEGWRWVEGLMAIFTGVIWIACSIYVPETYAPVLLRRRAAKLSKLTGKVYISKMDQHITATRAEQVKATLFRPWILLFTEPIVFLTAIYLAIVYGTLYLLFAAFPIVFQLNRGWSAGIGGLAFVGVAVGMLFAVSYSMYDNRRYMRARLPAIIGSVLLPIGLFWFAWTNGPEIHWIVPIIASAFFACGLVGVFLSLLTYMIDSYTVFAASVLAANSVLRSLFGAAFPLFTTYMYNDLGIHWASTIPAFLALACTPFPFLFYKYGAQIRMKCKYAAEAAAVFERMHAAAAAQQQQQQLAPRPSEQLERPEGLPVSESRAVLSEDEGTIIGEGDEMKEKRKST
ncbi:hypothetical protein N0V88_001983 [Collariella sp. IMI 366227]|nr:hypothetical protein N0V88_001983 [Collariella sp. IMI 366227]